MEAAAAASQRWKKYRNVVIESLNRWRRGRREAPTPCSHDSGEMMEVQTESSRQVDKQTPEHPFSSAGRADLLIMPQVC